MSDLPITPEEALLLVDAMEEEAHQMINSGAKIQGEEWLTKARHLRQYVEVSRHLYDAQKNPPREKS
jgi:hypothetical protein